jgi:hypothetical protein
MSELLPCPFCGSAFVAQGASRGYISVWCGVCFARGTEVVFPEDCLPGPPVDKCRELWNHRTPQSPSLPTPAATPTDSANPPPVESVGPNSEAQS